MTVCYQPPLPQALAPHRQQRGGVLRVHDEIARGSPSCTDGMTIVATWRNG